MVTSDDTKPSNEGSFASFNLSHGYHKPPSVQSHHPSYPPPSGQHIAHLQHIQHLLAKRPGPEYLSTRPGPGGTKFTYIEGWRAIELANDIFGFNGWSHETRSIDVDYVDQNPDGRFNVGVSAIVRISLKDGSTHEDVGYGKIDNCPTKGDALEKCKKEAVTDALKRSLRVFGNLLGNCLYDKNFLGNVKNVQAQKEKFSISKLHRPAYATAGPSAQANSTTNQTPKKSSTGPTVPVAPVQSTSTKPIISKPACAKSNVLIPPLKLAPKHKQSDAFYPPPEQLDSPWEPVAESVTTIKNRSVIDHGISEHLCSPSDNFPDLDESDLAELDANEQSMLQDQEVSEMTTDDRSLGTEPSVLLSDEIHDENVIPRGPPTMTRNEAHQILPPLLEVNPGKCGSNSNNRNNILDRSMTRPYQTIKATPARAMTSYPSHKAMPDGPTKPSLNLQAGQLPGLRGGAAAALNKSNLGGNVVAVGTGNMALDETSTRGVKRSIDRTRETSVAILNQVQHSNRLVQTHSNVQMNRSVTSAAGNQWATKAQVSSITRLQTKPQQQVNCAPQRQYHPEYSKPLGKVSDSSILTEHDSNAPKKFKT